MNQSRSPVAFGKYIITRRIARGGMAEIYRARTRASAAEEARWVAVKMMRSSLGHEELRERLFEREARIASKLHHANVVPIYEYGQEMDRPFLAMEYVRGRDLSHLLKNEKKGRELIPFEVGLYVGYLAARGLGHAHRLVDDRGGSLGIVHRDISPGNVMIGYDGAVKVLDFGVARMNETQGVHTQTGTLRGKFAYMSPEQTLGEDLDARSDVFSLGTVLYELLTGINCFRAQNPIATLERVQGLRPVPPSRANRAIPKTVDRILARCLAKDKKRRYKDAQALCEAIGGFLETIDFDGKHALTEHMSSVFSWEKHEEESELLREEEEVALFDVVDFAALRDDAGLDARHIAISQEEEASQSEVKNVRAHPIADDGAEVFDGDGSTSGPDRPASALHVEEEATVAQPAMFEETGANIEGKALQVSSLLEAAQPDAEASAPEAPPLPRAPLGSPIPEEPNDDVAATAARSNPMFAPSGMNLQSTLAQETAERTVMQPRRAPTRPAYQRPAVVIPLVGLLVLLVAGLVTMTASDDEPTTIEKPPPTTIAPVTITIEDEAEPPPEAPPPEARAAIDPPPGEDPAPGPEAAQEKVKERVEPKRAVKERRPARAATKRPERTKRRAPRRAPKRVTGTGFLNVGAKPWGQIKIDGKAWPYQTPQAGIELPTGKHTVTLSNPETGVTKKSVVYVKAGAYKTVMMDLRTK